MFNNVNLERMVEYREQALADGNCVGALYHMNRSCKLMSFIQYEMARRVAKDTKLPYSGFAGDRLIREAFQKHSLKQDFKVFLK
ncbi:2-hydroxyacyl-CoA dehydratase [Fusobacterium necrophorum]|uniref:2-hydroxyacyl-CoA dehydratase n=1 Tax=Fusobacterium necrophorum TaxID=859 RepID=UPI0028FC1E54|nr:2-hydroxyacyl-CoA dehydratase [Fusobacterium necrophorum]